MNALDNEPDPNAESDTDRRLRIGREIIEEFRRMTPEQRFQTKVDAGIYTQDGRLRKEYGGDA